MSDYINKVVSIVLIFVMLVISPLLLSYMSTDMVSQRLVLNDVTQFIDKVTDKYAVTEHDVNDLYLAVNSHGSAYDITVERYQLLEIPVPVDGVADDVTRLVYCKLDDIEQLMAGKVEGNTVDLNAKDVIKVHVEEVALSPGSKLFWTLLRVDNGKFDFSLAGTVR